MRWNVRRRARAEMLISDGESIASPVRHASNLLATARYSAANRLT